MKLSLEEIMELSAEAEQFRPMIQEGIKVLQSFGPEVYSVLEGIMNGAVCLKAGMVKRFMEEHKFTKKEAILLTTGLSDMLENSAKSINKSK